MRRPPRSPLFPSPTLFRSGAGGEDLARFRHAARPDMASFGHLAHRRTDEARAPLPEHADVFLDGGARPHPLVHRRGRSKSTRLNSSHLVISDAVFFLKKNN